MLLYVGVVLRLSEMPAKWWVVLSVAAASPAVAMVVRTRREAALALLTLALALPSFDFNLFYDPSQGGGYRLDVTLLDLMVLLLLGRWLWDALAQKTLAPRVSGSVLVGFLALPAVAAMSLFWAPNPGLGVFELVRLSKMISLALVTAYFVRSERDVRVIVWTILAVLLLEGAIALLQQFRGSGLGLSLLGEEETLVMQELGRMVRSRVSGTLRHANRLAMFLGFLLPTALAASLAPAGRPFRTIRLVARFSLLVGGMALLYTLSRAGWLSFAVASLAVLGLYWRRERQSRQFVRGFAFGLLLIAILVAANRDIIRERMAADDRGSFESRLPLAHVAVSITRDHPIFGSGFGNYRNWLPSYRVPGEPFTEIAKVHNVFLLVAAELGLTGLVIFLLLLATTFRQSWHGRKRMSGMPLLLSTGLLAGLVAFFIHGQVDYVEISRFAPLWFALGLLQALTRIQDNAGEGSR
jgi:hypothetical protein